ncbi:translation elongation factor Ts [Beutenbergia cavernae DSM 12333]|uniref:Elongation factor Ts n=1 Tax=Beutenbergia cavernae (strain ATCC BAA-8 / DSM 12333 / CCUG 43141 / JCM 11478 / NBRC 16432 / NCIMB 13614 / HKI 0122) TaxID=471853 RepID=EFTS_BEUC1|nr:translation elongation factor Ts [Beutenbergia cavernae]C5BWU0.1 RecName: Full=Elongation factor Ts; Short=EF-Ts [Beutenbergia cavernae DSM 12333]ACQ80756.1 translation elongation factor Ts [Beutenbergia cavernae DSM 12333]
MANYTAADIKTLREKSGAGMLDVKKALDEADGDAEKALEIIRVKGLKGVAKREGRSASEGLVAVKVTDAHDVAGQVGTMVELNAETDFVAKNATFVGLAERVLDAAVASAARDADALLAADAGGETVAEIVDGAAATLGEKLVLRRVARLDGEHVGVYLHRTSKDLPPQVGVMVATDAAAASVAEEIAMHVAAYSPAYLTREDVPEQLVADERRIAEETARNEGKPEQALTKIVEGRLNGFFKDQVLVDQAFARDPKKTVGQVVAETGGTLTGFARFRVGA